MKRFLVYLTICLMFAACGTSPAQAGNAQSIQFLLSQVRNASGPLAGGKVYAYEPGTLTPKTIWTDREETAAVIPPAILDANGTAQIYGDGVYRFIIKTAAGTTVYDRDNIPIGQPGLPFIATSKTSGDITSDVSAALASSCNVYIPSGTFSTSGGWQVRPGCSLEMSHDTVINSTSTTAPVIQIRSGSKVLGGQINLPAASTTASGIYLNGKDPAGFGVSNFTIRDTQINAPYNSYVGNGITFDVSDPTGTGSNCYIDWGTVDNVRAWYTGKGINVIAPISNTGAWTSSVEFNNFFAWRNTYGAYLPALVQNYTFSKPQIQWSAGTVNAFFVDGLYNVIDAPMMWDFPSTTQPLVLGPKSKHNTVNLAYETQRSQVFDQGTADNSINGGNAPMGVNSPAGNFNYLRDDGTISPGTPMFYGNQDDILAFADKRFTVTTSGNLISGNPTGLFRDNGFVIYGDPTVTPVQIVIDFGSSQNITTMGMNFYSSTVPSDFTVEWYDGTWHTQATVVDNRNSKYVLGISGYGTGMTKLRITVTKAQVRGSSNPNTFVALSRIWAISNDTAGYMYPTRMGGSFYGPVTATQFNVSDLNTAPTSASGTGTKGEIRITAGYIYICTATNTWVRAALATW